MAEESKAESIAKEVKAEVAADGVKGEATGVAVKAESANTVPTVRELFSLPEKETDPADENWKAFEERISQEVKGVKWTAAMPDLAQKICELLNISLPHIFLAAWKKAGELHAVLEKSKANPEDVTYLELTEHTLNSEHKPSVDVQLRGATVKKIELAVQLGFKLKGFVLKIQNGAIREMQTGHCEAGGSIKYGTLPIAEKKLEPIKLPFSIPITGGEVATAATEQAALSAKEKRPVSPPEVERIEL
ncbi:MAG: hypothetical protein DMF71_01360 [Acidobacteria bacterium]|nr:MAG: hypothetical protein DMF71_01360 [Acidobacteriota bacterium]